ncbi:MAG: glycosyltransferase family 9 protein, partial [Gemmatimonadaceae bacterium]
TPFGGPVGADTPTLKLDDAEERWAAMFLAANGASTEDLIVGIHPGASIPAKRWPLERFAEVATEILRRRDAKVLVFVAPDGYGESLAVIPGVITAKVGLRDLIALVARCDLLVCNDSGPMHIAGALGVPTVSVFGSGIQRWFSPLGERHHLLTAEHSARVPAGGTDSATPFDIAGVRTSQLLDAVNEVLGSNRS